MHCFSSAAGEVPVASPTARALSSSEAAASPPVSLHCSSSAAAEVAVASPTDRALSSSGAAASPPVSLHCFSSAAVEVAVASARNYAKPCTRFAHIYKQKRINTCWLVFRFNGLLAWYRFLQHVHPWEHDHAHMLHLLPLWFFKGDKAKYFCPCLVQFRYGWYYQFLDTERGQNLMRLYTMIPKGIIRKIDHIRPTWKSDFKFAQWWWQIAYFYGNTDGYIDSSRIYR